MLALKELFQSSTVATTESVPSIGARVKYGSEIVFEIFYGAAAIVGPIARIVTMEVEPVSPSTIKPAIICEPPAPPSPLVDKLLSSIELLPVVSSYTSTRATPVTPTTPLTIAV